MMKEYLLHCISLIDITVNNYVERSFTLLHINFGCTGGQHRSVFAAEYTAAHLTEKYNIVVTVIHQNKGNWVQP